MYGIVIYNSRNRHITIGTKKEKKLSLDIYQLSNQDPLEEQVDEFKEGQFSSNITGKERLSLLKISIKNRSPFAIGEETLGNIKGHAIELYLDVERAYLPMLRRPPFPESLEIRKEIETHFDELIDMEVIKKAGHNGIVEATTPVLINWHYEKSRLF
ncbi:hypothetical protein O181_009794 [Austropuccinia psidii MF-1]|uniref:Uncharacterized protein n=1 Tax=Austropuccinia psidii MF-1 TaxID=1389203 RepID=A0A9Q3GK73_9BASI|nr:hypothetical protein [Austropuccinia psidii MF-1]